MFLSFRCVRTKFKCIQGWLNVFNNLFENYVRKLMFFECFEWANTSFIRNFTFQTTWNDYISSKINLWSIVSSLITLNVLRIIISIIWKQMTSKSLKLLPTNLSFHIQIYRNGLKSTSLPFLVMIHQNSVGYIFVVCDEAHIFFLFLRVSCQISEHLWL